MKTSNQTKLKQDQVKAHVTQAIFAHNIEIKRYCDKKDNFEPWISMIRQKRNQFTVEGIINIRKHFVSLDSVASYFVGNPVLEAH